MAPFSDEFEAVSSRVLPPLLDLLTLAFRKLYPGVSFRLFLLESILYLMRINVEFSGYSAAKLVVLLRHYVVT